MRARGEVFGGGFILGQQIEACSRGRQLRAQLNGLVLHGFGLLSRLAIDLFRLRHIAAVAFEAGLHILQQGRHFSTPTLMGFGGPGHL